MSGRYILESRPAWLDYPETQKLLSLLDAPLYFRGGTVRDSLLGITPRDIDLVVDMPKQNVIERLEGAGFKIFPDNDARTILAKINGIEYDFMATRRDESISASFIARTGGAVTLDFTINSLYLSPEGELLNYYGGAEDLEAGRIRFAGDAKEQIIERYGHIIRFFRFHARYGIGHPDPVTLELCAKYAHHIPEIPARNIAKHMFYFLETPDVSKMLELMRSLGILDHIFGFTIRGCERVAALEMLGGISHIPPNTHSRMAALLLSATLPPLEALEHIRHKWDMLDDSYWQKHHLLTALLCVKANMSFSTQETLVKQLGAPAFKQLLLLAWAMERDPMAMQTAYQTMFYRLRDS